jgi:drug/metabolite transporter (DMT)-like permease
VETVDHVAPVRRPGLGTASAASAVVLWGASSVLLKQIDGLNGLGVAYYRVWAGAVVVTVFFVARGGRITARLLRASLFGGLAFLADLVLFFSAVQETSVANATVIGALQPVLVLAVSSRLFGERPRLPEVVWGAVAILGAALVVTAGDAGGANSLHGDVLAVGALVAWTLYFIGSKTARLELTALEYLTGMAIVAAVGALPLPLLFPGSLGTTNADGWLALAFITVVNGLLGHFLMSWAHGHVTLLGLSLLTLGIPVMSAAAAWLWLDEALVALQVLGMGVVVAALGLVSLSAARHRPDAVAADVQATEALPSP